MSREIIRREEKAITDNYTISIKKKNLLKRRL